MCAMCIRVLVLSPCSLPSRSFATSEFLDLQATGSMSKGFQSGFTDGTYGDVVPQNNSARHGEVARFTLQGFSTMAVLDLTTKDAALKGFAGGFTDGAYGSVVPYSNGA